MFVENNIEQTRLLVGALALVYPGVQHVVVMVYPVINQLVPSHVVGRLPHHIILLLTPPIMTTYFLISPFSTYIASPLLHHPLD